MHPQKNFTLQSRRLAWIHPFRTLLSCVRCWPLARLLGLNGRPMDTCCRLSRPRLRNPGDHQQQQHSIRFNSIQSTHFTRFTLLRFITRSIHSLRHSLRKAIQFHSSNMSIEFFVTRLQCKTLQNSYQIYGMQVAQ